VVYQNFRARYYIRIIKTIDAIINDLDEFDAYIVISFLNATLVLSVGETVEEVTDSGFLTDNTQTLNCQQIGADSIVQIYSNGIRHISGARRISEWKTPTGTTIVHSTCNNRQVAVSLSNQELIYFELDDNSGRLSECEERPDLGGEITCLAIGAVPEGRQRAKFLVRLFP
jgi:splicing factor 3B subunit 3